MEEEKKRTENYRKYLKLKQLQRNDKSYEMIEEIFNEVTSKLDKKKQ